MANLDSIFDRSIPELKTFGRRERLPIDADKLNNPIRALKTITRGVAPGRQIRTLRSSGISAIGIRQAKIVGGVGDDWWQGQFDPARDDDPVMIGIFKPWILRRSPFDGSARLGISYVYTHGSLRTATKDGDSEPQLIIPSYLIGDLVMVLRINVESLGLSVPVAPDIDSWHLDINVDGRMWAAEAPELAR